jgi:hypothetical protein
LDPNKLGGRTCDRCLRSRSGQAQVAPPPPSAPRQVSRPPSRCETPGLPSGSPAAQRSLRGGTARMGGLDPWGPPPSRVQGYAYPKCHSPGASRRPRLGASSAVCSDTAGSAGHTGPVSSSRCSADGTHRSAALIILSWSLVAHPCGWAEGNIPRSTTSIPPCLPHRHHQDCIVKTSKRRNTDSVSTVTYHGPSQVTS